MKLFGNSNAVSRIAPTDTIKKLRETLTMLEKREEYLQKQTADLTRDAKEKLAKKNKVAALSCLKRKKQYEAQISKVAGARQTLEDQILAIESATMNVETMNAMKLGAAQMAQMHQGLNVDVVDDTMADIKEQMDVADEISNAIGQPLRSNIDEDELEAELASLQDEAQQEKLDTQLADLEGNAAPANLVKTPSHAASVPAGSKAAASVTEEEEAQLRELEATMAM